MESTSWPLRIALLVIGLVVVGAIYLWALWRRRRETHRSYDRKMRGLRTPPMPRRRDDPVFEEEPDDEAFRPPPEDDYEIVVVKPRERVVEELPTITREPEPEPEASAPLAPPIVPEEPVGRAPRRRRTSQLSLGFGDEEAPPPPSSRPHRGERTERSERAERAERRAAAKAPPPPPPAPEVLALFLQPARSPALLGPVLLKALNAVGMRFGDMNIYHHFGAGDLRSTQPLFSLANMFEPGQFDLAAMDDFQTAGLAMFIQFPAPLDGPVAFELFLNTAQRLAEALDADLISEPNKPLDSATIENMRLVAARHSDQRS